MKTAVPRLSWFDHCPECDSVLIFALKPVSHSYLQLAFESRQATYACRRCGQRFQGDLGIYRLQGTLHCVPGLLCLVGAVFFDIPQLLVPFLLSIPIVLYTQNRIRFLTPLPKETRTAEQPC